MRQFGFVVLTALVATLVLSLSACETRQPSTVSQSEADNSQMQQMPLAQNNNTSAEDQSDEQVKSNVESAIYKLMDAMKAGNSTLMCELVDYDELLQLIDGQSDTNLLTILQHMQYSIEKITVTGQTAKADVSITNVDMHKVLPDYFLQANELYYNNALSSSPKSETELEQQAAALFEDTLDAHAANTVSELVAVELTMEDDEWRVQPTEALRTAVFGDFWSAQASLGENAG